MIESSLLWGGAIMLALFFGARAWSGAESAAGIEAFEASRAAVQSESEARSARPEDTAQPSLETIPDTSLWSERRREAYLSSREQSEDVPQAILDIDHLNIRVPVYDGASELNLNRGVARIIGTGRVGEGGNLGIAGHRDGFFRPLKDMEIGDRFRLETHDGTETYEVSSIEIVDPTELHVLAPTPNPTVTLVTCYPFYFVGNAPQRLIVKAEVVQNQVNS